MPGQFAASDTLISSAVMAALAAFATVKVMVRSNEKRIDAIAVRLEDESKQRKEANDFMLTNFYTKNDINRHLDTINNRFDSVMAMTQDIRSDIKHLADKIDSIRG